MEPNLDRLLEEWTEPITQTCDKMVEHEGNSCHKKDSRACVKKVRNHTA